MFAHNHRFNRFGTRVLKADEFRCSVSLNKTKRLDSGVSRARNKHAGFVNLNAITTWDADETCVKYVAMRFCKNIVRPV